MNDNEILALLNLLDDSDPQVNREVQNRLKELGPELLAFLDDHVPDISPEAMERLDLLLDDLRTEQLASRMKTWSASAAPDLLEGMLLLEQLRAPGIQRADLEQSLEKVRLDAWLELHYDLSPLEKIRILNHVFFKIHGFRGDKENYHDPENSYLGKVLQNHRGNPITLSVAYMLVAHRLNIPVFGVNMPQHFILVYMDDEGLSGPESFGDRVVLDPANFTKAWFYINPFDEGQVFGRKNVEEFLKELKFPLVPEYFMPCSPQDILRRALRNLHYAYAQAKMNKKYRQVEELMKAMGMDDELQNSFRPGRSTDDPEPDR